MLCQCGFVHFATYLAVLTFKGLAAYTISLFPKDIALNVAK